MEGDRHFGHSFWSWSLLAVAEGWRLGGEISVRAVLEGGLSGSCHVDQLRAGEYFKFGARGDTGYSAGFSGLFRRGCGSLARLEGDRLWGLPVVPWYWGVRAV